VGFPPVGEGRFPAHALLEPPCSQPFDHAAVPDATKGVAERGSGALESRASVSLEAGTE
jgi:hypothetical protein